MSSLNHLFLRPHIHRHWCMTLPLPLLHLFIFFFDIHSQSWHETSRHGEPSHRLDKLESSQHPCYLVFVVFACLAAVSSDDYQTHRHSSSHGTVLSLTFGSARRQSQVWTRLREVDAAVLRFCCWLHGGGLSKMAFLVDVSNICSCLLTHSRLLLL